MAELEYASASSTDASSVRVQVSLPAPLALPNLGQRTLPQGVGTATLQNCHFSEIMSGSTFWAHRDSRIFIELRFSMVWNIICGALIVANAFIASNDKDRTPRLLALAGAVLLTINLVVRLSGS